MSRIIAWHLPQFYPFAENDRWWGPGFTEWTLLRNWQPLFDEHRIRRPHPDIGEYILLSTEARKRQGDMARRHGVHGFCYYHYWFNGKRLLEKPLELMLADGQPDLPYCLSWANETWTRRWLGMDDAILIEQTYGHVDEWDAHLDSLLPFFRHRNYIQVDGKPMFLVYRLGRVPDYAARFRHWQTRLRREGFAGLHLVMTLGTHPDQRAPIAGADAVVEFYPGYGAHGHTLLRRLKMPWIARTVRTAARMINGLLGGNQRRGLVVRDASATYERAIRQPQLHRTHYRGLFSGWDNSPRTGKQGIIFEGISPELFCAYLRLQRRHSTDFVFVNGWNEWSEGAVLEPDDQFGYGFLEAVARSA